MNSKTLLTILALATTSACGASLVKNGETIAFIGDSITEFGNDPAGYINMVIKGFELAHLRVAKIPVGHSAETSQNMARRFERDVVAAKPDWVTISCGVNDVARLLDKSTGKVDFAAYKANVRTMLDQAQSAGIRPVLLTPTLRDEEKPDSDENQQLLALCAFLREEARARNIPLADLNTRMRNTLASLPPAKGPRLTKDGVHMNFAGNAMMATGVLEAFGLSVTPAMQAAWRDLPAGASTYCILSQAQMERLLAREQPGEDRTACAHRLVVEGVTGPITAPPPRALTPANPEAAAAALPPVCATATVAFVGDRVFSYGAGGYCGFGTMVETASRLTGTQLERRQADINGKPTRELVAKAQALAADKPQRAVLGAGCYEVRTKGDWTHSFAELKKAMSDMMDAFQNAGSDLLVLGLPLLDEKGVEPDLARVREYNAWLKESCARRKVRFVDLAAAMTERLSRLGPPTGEKLGEGRFISGSYHVILSFEGKALVAEQICQAFGLDVSAPKYLAAWKDLGWQYNLTIPLSVNEFAALERRAAEVKLGARDLAGRLILGLPLAPASSDPFAPDAETPGARYQKLPRLDCTTDKSPVAYACGETAVVTFTTPHTNGLAVSWTLRRDGSEKVEKGSGSVVKVSLDKPGFVWISATAGDGKWPFAADCSIGFDVEKIRVTSKYPDDLVAFWSARKKEVASIAMNPRVAEVASPTPGVKLYKVELDAPGMGGLTSGWLSVPQRADAKYPALVRFFGYGNSWAEYHHVAPKSCAADRIEFLVNAHAYGLERDKAHYDAVYAAAQSNGHTHGMDPVQNARPETCYFLGMALRDLTAMRYLKTRPEWDGVNLMVKGASQGGLQAAWMASLCEGVSVMCAEVPWNCNMAGWTEGRIRPTRLPIEDAAGLAYFDPCHLAVLMPQTLDARIVRAGLGDYCCPPSGVAAFYNAIPCPRKSIRWAQASHHSDLPIDTRWTEVSTNQTR